MRKANYLLAVGVVNIFYTPSELLKRKRLSLHNCLIRISTGFYAFDTELSSGFSFLLTKTQKRKILLTTPFAWCFSSILTSMEEAHLFYNLNKIYIK